MLKNGQVVTHSQLADLFGVKTLKNTRFIKERNALVIITDYTYSGPAKLAGDPYTEMGPDNHLVWVFPIQPNQGDLISKPNGLVFSNMEDFRNRGDQSIRHFVRRRDNYIGCRVRHREHGLGAVNSFDGTNITVTFRNNQTKTYNFNKSFQGGYIQFLD